jgi:hypothetical protein
MNKRGFVDDRFVVVEFVDHLAEWVNKYKKYIGYIK